MTETWPISVRDPLPVVPVLPFPGDLGHVLRFIYDEARYDLSTDYSQPPTSPLTEDDAAWARTLLEKREDVKRNA